MRFIHSRGLSYYYVYNNNLREIVIKGIKIIFVYEYCLSNMMLRMMCPEKDSIIVNLHNWNGKSCISNEAYETAERMGVTLLTMDDFYEFVENTVARFD
jgi:hypothetical protein